MDKSQEFGCGATQLLLPPDVEQSILEEIKEHAEKTGQELVLNGAVIGLTGEEKESVRKNLDAVIKNTKFLGSKIIRGNYGRLQVKYSRFNKEIPIKEHMQFVIDNLKAAAPIFEDAGLYFSMENHCDFTGKEYGEIFAAVNSKHIGCTLDTANDFTVFFDPNEGNEYMAEFAITTHLKDMLVQDFHSEYGLPMFQARGCALGDGHVNIPRVLQLINEKSPLRDGMHLVIEHGWMNIDGVADPAEHNRQCLEKGLAYLKKCIGRE